MSTPSSPSGSGPIFRWVTLKEVGRRDYQHRGRPVPGKVFEVELTSGPTVLVWRADDGRQYFCHGLTFGGKKALGGPVSPCTGRPVETILREYYDQVPEADAKKGDILVWRGIGLISTPHSAVLTGPVVVRGTDYLDYATRLRTKNGFSAERTTTLLRLIRAYGESYNVYRRR